MQKNKQEFSSIKIRILEYLDCKGVTPYSFYKDSGVTRGILTQPNGLSEDNLHKFLSYARDISPIWLLSGNGEMIDEKNCKVNCEVDCKEDKKNADVDAKNGYLDGYPNGYFPSDREKIGEKKCIPKCIPECIPAKNFDKKNVDLNVDLNVDVDAKNSYLSRDIPTFQAREVQRGGIPLIPLEAAAGILSGTEVQIMDYECEHFVIPGFKNADFMIQITGDSMLPKYESGDVVACQRLPMSTFFQWNCVYVVDSEQGILIKRVKQGSDKEHIELVSENEKYGAFELHLGDINGLGRVVGLVRFE